jgi:hypothetical protein
MPSRAVPGFLPSTHGFAFANRWPPGPALSWRLGLVQVGLGDTALGLCGGMAYVVRDRFEQGGSARGEVVPPAPGTALFREVVRRQLDSFDRLVVVPWRFWRAASSSRAARNRLTATVSWPAIRAQVDAGRLAVVGLLRTTSRNPSLLGVNHQVLAYGYDEAGGAVMLRIYDPNHPGDDDVRLTLAHGPGGELALGQSTGEQLFGLLALPYVPPPAGRR